MFMLVHQGTFRNRTVGKARPMVRWDLGFEFGRQSLLLLFRDARHSIFGIGGSQRLRRLRLAD